MMVLGDKAAALLGEVAQVDRGALHPLIVLMMQGKLHTTWPGQRSFHTVVCVVAGGVGIYDGELKSSRIVVLLICSHHQ